MESGLEFRAMHEVPNFIIECAEVLNEEWKRSLTARLHSLEKSRDELPICLVLLENTVEECRSNKQNVTVIGHSKLSDVRGQTTKSCLVESVVVKKSHRGKGYGKIVMERTEQFAKSKGYETMYLTTHDKQDFYKHLGYDFCSPIISIGSDILPEHLAQRLMGSLNVQGNSSQFQSVGDKSKLSSGENNSSNIAINDNTTHTNCDIGIQVSICVSSSAPHPPPPPPARGPLPPAPPIRGPLHPPVKPGDQTVTRWDPSKVSWMKKTISCV